jgi:hypothetical protein
MTSANDKPGINIALPDGDQFNPARLRLPQDFGAEMGVKKALLTIPVRKPDKQTFFRVNSDARYRVETAVLEVKEDRETYLVEPELWSDLAGEVVPKVLFTTITKQGVLSLWPIRLPGPDGRHDVWNRSALEAAELAMHKWIRLAANMSLGAYDVYEATGNLAEPEWPAVPFEVLLRTAFRDRFIDSLDHPVVRRLRGES